MIYQKKLPTHSIRSKSSRDRKTILKSTLQTFLVPENTYEKENCRETGSTVFIETIE